jgi:hypothetical protein
MVWTRADGFHQLAVALQQPGYRVVVLGHSTVSASKDITSSRAVRIDAARRRVGRGPAQIEA